MWRNRKMAKDINPKSKITIFHEGVFEHNIDSFLDGVDIYVYSLDFFAYQPELNAEA
jgi:molybdopterin/thiamine biosynthesis adenylyltransferase